MRLEDWINSDIKAAMMAREKEKLEALRAVKSALLLAAAEKGAEEMTEETEIRLLQKLVKQRREAAEVYTGQNRKDLADVEIFQADIIQQYLPVQMSRDELVTEIRQLKGECGAEGMKDLGKVMSLASKKFAGRADNKLVSEIARELLSG